MQKTMKLKPSDEPLEAVEPDELAPPEEPDEPDCTMEPDPGTTDVAQADQTPGTIRMTVESVTVKKDLKVVLTCGYDSQANLLLSNAQHLGEAVVVMVVRKQANIDSFMRVPYLGPVADAEGADIASQHVTEDDVDALKAQLAPIYREPGDEAESVMSQLDDMADEQGAG